MDGFARILGFGALIGLVVILIRNAFNRSNPNVEVQIGDSSVEIITLVPARGSKITAYIIPTNVLGIIGWRVVISAYNGESDELGRTEGSFVVLTKDYTICTHSDNIRFDRVGESLELLNAYEVELVGNTIVISTSIK